MGRVIFAYIIILAVCFIFSAGCGEKAKELEGAGNSVIVPEKSENQQEEVKMGKILFIIAQQDFRDEELYKPRDVLEDKGYQVDVASITTAPAIGKLGMEVTPDIAVKDVNAEDYDYVAVVGGPGAPSLAEYEEVIELIRSAKKVGAICIAPTILAKAGVLNGKRATVFKTKESLLALKQGGALYVEKPVVVDGTTVTAWGPDAAEEFGERIAEVLGG